MELNSTKTSHRVGTNLLGKEDNQDMLRGVWWEMAAFSLQHHMQRAHGRVFLQVRGVDVGGGGLDIYKVLFLWILKSVD